MPNSFASNLNLDDDLGSLRLFARVQLGQFDLGIELNDLTRHASDLGAVTGAVMGGPP